MARPSRRTASSSNRPRNVAADPVIVQACISFRDGAPDDSHAAEQTRQVIEEPATDGYHLLGGGGAQVTFKGLGPQPERSAAPEQVPTRRQDEGPGTHTSYELGGQPVLPTPASPTRRTHCRSPTRDSARAPRSTAGSRARPTNLGPRDRGGMWLLERVPANPMDSPGLIPFLNEGALGTSTPRPAERSCGPGIRWWSGRQSGSYAASGRPCALRANGSCVRSRADR
jgi:hypothetical protein